MPDANGRTNRPSPTSPGATESLVELSEGGEAFAEPSGTLAEARREGDVDETGSQLDDAAARQARLEEARETMSEAAESGGAEGLGVQEEETARIADHLVFPGTGMRELREQGRVEEVIEQVADADLPSPTDNPDRFPPSEWPRSEQARESADRPATVSGDSAEADEDAAWSGQRVISRSRQLLGEPWMLAGACLGAGVVIGLSVRAITDRFGQPASGGNEKAKAKPKAKPSKGKVAKFKKVTRNKIGDAKDAVSGTAGQVLDTAKDRANRVKETAKDAVGQVKETAKDTLGQVKETAKDKVGGPKDAGAKDSAKTKADGKDSGKARPSTAKGSSKAKSDD